jgi:hypothetical protein
VSVAVPWSPVWMLTVGGALDASESSNMSPRLVPGWSGAETTCRGSPDLRLSNLFFMTHLPGQCSEKLTCAAMCALDPNNVQ